MTVITETNNQTAQQAPITASNATYILDGGSISLNSAIPALAIDTIGLANLTVILWNSLIENQAFNGKGIETNSSLRVELGDQASIRTGGAAILASAATASLAVFNRGVITSTSAVAIQSASDFFGSSVVNFGHIRGFPAVNLAGTANNSVENAGTIESTLLSGAAILFGIGADTLTNSGYVGGGVSFGGGNDVLLNSGDIRAVFAILDNGGTNEFTNTGSIVSANSVAFSLAVSDDRIRNGGHIFGAIFLGDGVDTVFNTGTLDGGLNSAISAAVESGNKAVVNSGTIRNDVALGIGNDSVTNTGTIIGDVFFGAGGDVYDGSLGAVTGLVDGGTGGDSLTGSAFSDRILGGNDSDVLEGREGDDTLSGGSGNDRLTGGAGSDVIFGGSGIDAVSFDRAVRVSLADPALNTGEAAGDRIDDVEDILGSESGDRLAGDGGNNFIKGGSGNDVLEGADGADTLFGESGSDTLTGGAGIDLLAGGVGNDTYVLDNGSDAVADEGGTDTITSTISRSLASLPDIENLTLLGSAAINGTGNALANLLTGNAAANTLNGSAGADTLRGRGGNDTYVVDNALDTVDETGGAGTDRVISSVSFSLVASAHVIGAFEHLTLSGTAAINGTGNALANIIVGNTAANVLGGGAGNDTISAGNGNDKLFGGTGNDRLTGGANNDIFVFNTGPNTTTNLDKVTDFTHVSDTFHIDNAVFTSVGANGTLSAAAFRVGAAAADASDRIVYNPATGALIYDSNGSAAGGAVQFAVLLNRPANVAVDDFVVI